MNAKVDQFLKRAKQWKPEMELLREIALSCRLDEDLKWGKPCYSFEGSNQVIIVGFKNHCAYIFCKGALLADPKKILIKPGEHTQAARQARFSNLATIEKLQPTLKAYLKEAIAAQKAGREVEYKKITERPVPEELQRKLKESPELKKAFAALTPGRQRAYLMHFSDAKQSATREARIEKCRSAILSGKGWNEEYKSKK